MGGLNKPDLNTQWWQTVLLVFSYGFLAGYITWSQPFILRGTNVAEALVAVCMTVACALNFWCFEDDVYCIRYLRLSVSLA